MTTMIIDIADNKATDLSKYAKKIGGHVVAEKKEDVDKEDDEVTHEVYFGENIKRLIKAFS